MKILNAHQASLINAISLILIGGYGYLQSETPSPTALIPVIFGVLLIVMSPGVKNENKIIEIHEEYIKPAVEQNGVAIQF